MQPLAFRRFDTAPPGRAETESRPRMAASRRKEKDGKLLFVMGEDRHMVSHAMCSFDRQGWSHGAVRAGRRDRVCDTGVFMRGPVVGGESSSVEAGRLCRRADARALVFGAI